MSTDRQARLYIRSRINECFEILGEGLREVILNEGTDDTGLTIDLVHRYFPCFDIDDFTEETKALFGEEGDWETIYMEELTNKLMEIIGG